MISQHKMYICFHSETQWQKKTEAVKMLLSDYPGCICSGQSGYHLIPEIRDTYQGYIFVPSSVSGKISHDPNFRSMGFRRVGPIKAAELEGMFERSQAVSFEGLEIGSLYRLDSGEFKNLFVKLESLDGPMATCSFEIFDELRTIEVSVTQLKPTDEVEKIAPSLVNYKEQAMQAGQKKAIIIDGHNILFRNVLAKPNVYSSATRKFVGGAQGFYYSLLSLAQRFSEYQIFVVFDRKDTDKFEKFPEYKANRLKYSDKFWVGFNENLQWVKDFAQAAGMGLVDIPETEGDDTVGILATHLVQEGFVHVIINSADTDFFQLTTEDGVVELLQPKNKPSGNTRIVNAELAKAEIGVRRLDMINAARALLSDKSDNISGVNRYNSSKGYVIARATTQELLDIVNMSENIAEVRERLSLNKKTWYFKNDGKFDSNLELLTIKREAPEGFHWTNYVKPFDDAQCRELLEKFTLYTELEAWSKSSNILRNLW